MAAVGVSGARVSVEAPVVVGEGAGAGGASVSAASRASVAASSSSSSAALGPRVLEFYGHGHGRPFREFSNFYQHSKPFPFRLPSFARREGFPEVVSCWWSEAAIMLSKAALMGDRPTFEKMQAAMTQDSVKALGRNVKPFDDELWKKHLEDIAFEVVFQKFASDEALAEVLLSTGDRTIAEATRNDKLWGIGIDVGDPRAQDPKQWNGRNVLGTALMRARQELRRRRRGGGADEGASVSAASRASNAASSPSSSAALGPRVIEFYGHGHGRPFREFSNFYQHSKPFPFRLPSCARREGFPEVVSCWWSEAAIMLSKAALMGDRPTFEKMQAAMTQDSVKALGRSVKPFDDELWKKHLEDIAFEVVFQKFASDEALAEVLLSTGDRTIAEATRNDELWGIGIDVGDPRAQDPKQWNGRNVLGTALMRAREELRRRRRGGGADGGAGGEEDREMLSRKRLADELGD